MRRTSFIVALALVLPFSVSSAVVIRVPSQAPSIQEAIDWSSDGDTLLVAPGTYTGWPNTNLDFSGKSVSLLSEGGADVTTIDGEGARRAFGAVWGEDVVIEGFTVVNGYQSFGGAVLIDDTATAVLRDCRFLGCGAAFAGVVFCTDDALGVFEDCVFQDCTASIAGGVAYVRSAELMFDRCEFAMNDAPLGGVFRSQGNHGEAPGGYTTVNDCTFIGNSANGGSVLYSEWWSTRFYADRCEFFDNVSAGGMINCASGRFGISNCLFAQNTSGSRLVYAGSGWTSLTNTTFVENSSEYGLIHVPTAVSNVIVAFSTQGPAFSAWDPPTLSCCDVFGNAGGDWIEPIASQLGVNGNICEDPLFCGASSPANPYSLHENSPCAASNSGGCGTIGLWDEECGVSATQSSTWGSIKARYR